MQVPKILIVDDEPEFLETIVRITRKSDRPYEIFKANSARMALEIARLKLPDLVITDWEMPQMSGIELIRALKSDTETSHIPVIMCTGRMTASSNLKIAFDSGAVDYIRKPIDEIELIARISSMLMLVNSLKTIHRQKEEILKKDNQILQARLDLKNRELTTQTLNVIQKRETLASIIDELEKIGKAHSADPDLGKQLQNLISRITVNSSESNWQYFKHAFEDVNPGFFRKIAAEFPSLTANEIKLCALLKLNMSSKEISLITHQSLRSIEVARYRLRKKLKMDNEESFYSFFLTC